VHKSPVLCTRIPSRQCGTRGGIAPLFSPRTTDTANPAVAVSPPLTVHAQQQRPALRVEDPRHLQLADALPPRLERVLDVHARGDRELETHGLGLMVLEHFDNDPEYFHNHVQVVVKWSTVVLQLS
jgi:hypothetical protein